MLKKIFVFLIILSTVTQADPGIGLSTDPNESVTLVSLPFTYGGNFRVYNTGDEERVFIIDIIAPYPDVLDWVTVDASVFSLMPDETMVINFSLYIENSYAGSFDILFKPTLLPTQTAATTGTAAALLSLSAIYKFTVVVPEPVGKASLGTRPSSEETPQPQTVEITKTVSASENAGSVKSLNKTIKLNAPERAKIYEPVSLSVGFVEGGEPAGLGFLLVSPTNKQYKLRMSDTFQFDEEGKWSLLVVIENNVILGNTILIEKDTMATVKHRILPQYGIAILAAILVAASLVVFMVKRRRK